MRDDQCNTSSPSTKAVRNHWPSLIWGREEGRGGIVPLACTGPCSQSMGQCVSSAAVVKVKCKKLLESVCANFAPNETYTYVFGGWVEPMRDVLSRMRQYRFQQHATRMLLTERRQVAHAAQVGDPAVVRRVVRRYLARREVARARH